jgi:hypothetical protein
VVVLEDEVVVLEDEVVVLEDEVVVRLVLVVVLDCEPRSDITDTVLTPKSVTNTSCVEESYAAPVGYSPAVTEPTTVLLLPAIIETM